MKTKKELRKIAKQVIKTNLIIWKAIHAAEEFSKNDIHLMDQEDIVELAKIMATMEDGAEAIAEPEHYGLYFQQFEYFGRELEKHLDDNQ